MSISPIERQIIQATQTGLPLVPEPYQVVANQLGISQQEVMQCLQAMLEKGVIRRIAAVPNHYQLGYRHNGMSVWDIDDNQVDHFGQLIAELPFVSHCYQRPRHLPHWPYNLFAMVHGKTAAEADQQVDLIASMLGAANRQHTVLYSTKILKKTGLRLAS